MTVLVAQLLFRRLSPVLALISGFLLTGSLAIAAGQRTGNADGTLSGAPPVGNVLYAEHYAFVRVGIPEGLGGPARQAGKSHAWAFCAQDAAKNFFVAEPQNEQVHWIDMNGIDRIIAGDGRKGFRDGPGARARFDFGCGSYNDLQLHCDDAGNVYVSDGMNNRLRKIFRQDDGSWHVTTVSGGGTRRIKKGEWATATDLRFGCATRWGLSPDGKVAAYATYGGVYKVLLQENKATLVASQEDVARDTGSFGKSWHVDGGHITSDGAWYYWAPTADCKVGVVRCNLASGKSERVAGPGKACDDSTDALSAGFHTVFATYAPDASVIYMGGGDEFACRRIAGGKVQHLLKDGTWKAMKGENGTWVFGGSGLYLGRDGKLYTIPPPYSWPGWVTRATFAKEGVP
jgi:hypothetical protein